MANGQERAAANIAKFEVWASERQVAGDWTDYIRQGQLNRTEIAAECGFAKSALRQNPAVKTALEALEVRLRAEGTLPSGKGKKSPQAQDEAASASVEQRIVTLNNRTEQRVNALEEQNAALRAEVRELREQLKRYQIIDDHLAQTGRLVRP
ncbi:VPA1267 family protein [Halomonas sp. CH40]